MAANRHTNPIASGIQRSLESGKPAGTGQGRTSVENLVATAIIGATAASLVDVARAAPDDAAATAPDILAELSPAETSAFKGFSKPASQSAAEEEAYSLQPFSLASLPTAASLPDAVAPTQSLLAPTATDGSIGTMPVVGELLGGLTHAEPLLTLGSAGNPLRLAVEPSVNADLGSGDTGPAESDYVIDIAFGPKADNPINLTPLDGPDIYPDRVFEINLLKTDALPTLVDVNLFTAPDSLNFGGGVLPDISGILGGNAGILPNLEDVVAGVVPEIPIVSDVLGGGTGSLPIVGDLLGGGSGSLPIVGDLLGGGTGSIPVVGELLGGSTGSIPVVGDLLGGGTGSLPVVGDLLGSGTGSIPVVGDLLGGGTGSLPVVGDLLGGGTGSIPVVNSLLGGLASGGPLLTLGGAGDQLRLAVEPSVNADLGSGDPGPAESDYVIDIAFGPKADNPINLTLLGGPDIYPDRVFEINVLKTDALPTLVDVNLFTAADTLNFGGGVLPDISGVLGGNADMLPDLEDLVAGAVPEVPVVGDILGGNTGSLPVVGDLLGGSTSGIPVVGDLVDGPADGGPLLTLASAGDQLRLAVEPSVNADLGSGDTGPAASDYVIDIAFGPKADSPINLTLLGGPDIYPDRVFEINVLETDALPTLVDVNLFTASDTLNFGGGVLPDIGGLLGGNAGMLPDLEDIFAGIVPEVPVVSDVLGGGLPLGSSGLPLPIIPVAEPLNLHGLLSL